MHNAIYGITAQSRIWTGGIPPYEWIGGIIAPGYGYEYGDDTLPIYEYYLHNPENFNVEACYLYVPVREKQRSLQ